MWLQSILSWLFYCSLIIFLPKIKKLELHVQSNTTLCPERDFLTQTLSLLSLPLSLFASFILLSLIFFFFFSLFTTHSLSQTATGICGYVCVSVCTCMQTLIGIVCIHMQAFCTYKSHIKNWWDVFSYLVEKILKCSFSYATISYNFIECVFDRERCSIHRDLHNNYPMQFITAFIVTANFKRRPLKCL